MKLIVAMIEPDRLSAVRLALEETSAPLISAVEVHDLRAQSSEVYRGVEYQAGRIRLRLEVLLLNEVLIEETVRIIARACVGDSRPHGAGSILILPVEDWFSLRDHEPRFASPVAA